MDLIDGDIVFTSTKVYWYKPSTWPAWIIQKFSKSKTNHVLTIISLYDQLFIMEANGKEIDLVPLFKRINMNYRIYRLPKSRDLIGLSKKEILQLQKTKYDKKSLLRHFLFFIFKRWFGKDSNNSYNCVEFVAKTYKFSAEDYSKVTPAKFEESLKDFLVYGNY